MNPAMERQTMRTDAIVRNPKRIRINELSDPDTKSSVERITVGDVFSNPDGWYMRLENHVVGPFEEERLAEQAT